MKIVNAKSKAVLLAAMLVGLMNVSSLSAEEKDKLPAAPAGATEPNKTSVSSTDKPPASRPCAVDWLEAAQ